MVSKTLKQLVVRIPLMIAIAWVLIFLLSTPAEAIIYCEGDLAHSEEYINGNRLNHTEDCSLAGARCINGVGCEVPTQNEDKGQLLGILIIIVSIINYILIYREVQFLGSLVWIVIGTGTALISTSNDIAYFGIVIIGIGAICLFYSVKYPQQSK